MNNQILLIDIDNTILPLIEEVVDRYNNTYNDSLTIENFKKYNVKEFIKPECTSLFKEFCTPDLFQKVVPYDGAVEQLTVLNEMYQLCFLTSGHANTMEHRDHWLDRHFKFYSTSQLIMSRKKQLLVGDALIDDHLDNLVDGQYKGIIYTMPWNKDINEKQCGMKRISGWNFGSTALIQELMERKREREMRNIESNLVYD